MGQRLRRMALESGVKQVEERRLPAVGRADDRHALGTRLGPGFALQPFKAACGAGPEHPS